MTLSDMKIFEKFACINTITNKRCRAVREDVDHVFVFLKGKRKYGRRYLNADFLMDYQLIEKKDETEEWHRRIRRAIRCLEKSGLWTDKLPVLHNMLLMTWEDHQEINKQYWDSPRPVDFTTSEWDIWFQKYPFIKVYDNAGVPYIDNTYFWDGSDVKLKSMYFGRLNQLHKEDIKQSIQEKRTCNLYRIPVGYDVTFNYNPNLNKAWYAEEYRGCGNGHYYIALDHNTAWFMEDD